MNERLLEDMVTLCDGVIKEFCGYSVEWEKMSEEDKKRWCSKFASEHARPIDTLEEE